MSSTSFTALAYILVFLILGVRLFLVIARGIQLFVLPEYPWWKAYFFLDLKFWRRVFSLVIDLILSLGMGILIRILIPGTASGAVGATVGLMISLGIQGMEPYVKSLRYKAGKAPLTA